MRVRLQARSSLLSYYWAGGYNTNLTEPPIQSKEPPIGGPQGRGVAACYPHPAGRPGSTRQGRPFRSSARPPAGCSETPAREGADRTSRAAGIVVLPIPGLEQTSHEDDGAATGPTRAHAVAPRGGSGTSKTAHQHTTRRVAAGRRTGAGTASAVSTGGERFPVFLPSPLGGEGNAADRTHVGGQSVSHPSQKGVQARGTCDAPRSFRQWG